MSHRGRCKRGTIRWLSPLLSALLLTLVQTTASASTSSEFGLSPREIGRLQTPHSSGNQIFSSPVSIADHDETQLELFVTHRLNRGTSKEPITYLGASLFIPFVPSSQTSWLSGLGFGLGNPSFGLFRAEGSTETKALSSQSQESLDLRTTLNSRPIDGLDIALGIRSLARLVGSIDVKVADAGNETFVINRLITSFRPEMEVRWKKELWGIQSGYRHRLVVDYDVPLQAALEDPVPLELPTLSITGIAFIEQSALWASGFLHHAERSWGWRTQVKLPEPRGIGLSGLTPTENREVLPLERRWTLAISNGPRALVPDEPTLTYAAGLSIHETSTKPELKFRAGITAELQHDERHYSIGCATQFKSKLQPTTLVCSLALNTSWERVP